MTLGYEDLTQWSIVANNNGNADSAINWIEHQPRNSVNDSARSVMAALAKNRDMQNGSIVTAGSANAQTATTPVGFGGATIPTGTRLAVKVGSGLTNTAAGLTLAVDGATPSGVLNMLGQSPGPGEWSAGTYVALIFDGTYWNMATSLPGVFTPAYVENGKFVWQSATACALVPFKGNQIKINGANYSIPSSGVTFANTGVNVGGTTGANLGPNTTYLVGVQFVGGVLTPYYTTTLTHTTSTTIGNVGTEIVGSNDAISVVGMVRTNASSQFVDSTNQRFVRSWFNRRRVAAQNSANVPSYGFSTGGSVIAYAVMAEFVCFADDCISVRVPGFNDSNVANDLMQTFAFLDGASFTGLPGCYSVPAGAGLYAAFAPSASGYAADGYHYAQIGAGCVAGHSLYWAVTAEVG